MSRRSEATPTSSLGVCREPLARHVRVHACVPRWPAWSTWITCSHPASKRQIRRSLRNPKHPASSRHEASPAGSWPLPRPADRMTDHSFCVISQWALCDTMTLSARVMKGTSSKTAWARPRGSEDENLRTEFYFHPFVSRRHRYGHICVILARRSPSWVVLQKDARGGVC